MPDIKTPFHLTAVDRGLRMTDENICPYLPINSHRAIGDFHSVALIASDGTVDWGCFPDFDSPAIFCRLLDAKRGGYFQIAPSDTAVAGSQHYLPGSNVLRTTFSSDAGKVVLTDFMPIETFDDCSSHQQPHYSRVDGDNSRQCLVRIVACTDGELPITSTLKVTPNYAAAPSEAYLVSEDKGAVISSENQCVGLAIIGAYRISAFSIRVSQDEMWLHPIVIAQITLREGEHIQFILGIRRDARDAHRMVEVELPQRNFYWELGHTLYCWRRWTAHCNSDGPYFDWVQRSPLILKWQLSTSSRN
jgi:alpha,alpha-trehalase